MKVHNLKTWPQEYKDTVEGKKTFEVRNDDRNYEEGDILNLQEYSPDKKEYTGEESTFSVDYVFLGDRFGLKQGYVAMSISPI